MTKATASRAIPGDRSIDSDLESMIRVDHAGEYGAQRIYAGQMAVLRKDPSYNTIKHMAEQETEHLHAFENIMRERRVRPSALMPFWHVAGFALGAGTALLGTKAAMACTVAVESVIGEHYQHQEDALADNEQEKDLRRTISKFRAEEQEHHDIGLEHDAENAPFYDLLSTAIKGGTHAAIWLAKRI